MGSLGMALESIHAPKKNSDTPKSDKVVLIHYTKLHRAPYQYSHKGKTPEQYEQEVRELKDEIKVAGKVLQPLLVRKIDVDDYEIIGGQHRRDASELLVVEDGDTKYELCPCIITNMTDAQAEYAALGTNKNWEKSEWHTMHEITRKKFLIENYPEDFPHIPDKGRMVDKLALEMKMPKSTVGEYLQISKNLSDSAMDSFENGEINKSAAVALSSLAHEEQDKLIDAGVTKQKDIKAYKEEKVEKTTHRTTVTESTKRVSTHNMDDYSNPNEDDVPNFGTDVIIESIQDDTLDGQMKLLNTEMELIEEKRTSNVESTGRTKCPTCGLPSRIEDTFVFYGTRYCMHCLDKLIQDLEDTGVIKLDRSEINTNGVMVRS